MYLGQFEEPLQKVDEIRSRPEVQGENPATSIPEGYRMILD
jgi:hypothetical protein